MKKYVKWISILFLAAVIIFLVIPLPHPLFEKDYSTVVLDRRGDMLRVFLNENEQWCFPPDDTLKLPEKLKTAVLYYEDKYFYRHPGVNIIAVIRAAFQNIAEGEIISGASTITMQAARLMQPKPRTFPNKLLEMLQALKIETQYSKDQILRLYLDHAPYGGNIVGYRAASQRYFRKVPDALTWSEAAALVVLPNAPGLLSPTRNPDAFTVKRNRLLKRLQSAGIIDAETCRLACLEAAPRESYQTPVHAAHLARRLKNDIHSGGTIKTTIDRALQKRMEQLVSGYSERLQAQAIKNCAALVVDTRSGAVHAYVGSQDFFDPENKGQVDGVMAPRSSGSILKPFLYALSMDAGLVLPQTVIHDVPSFYGSFSPANADESYSGLTTARLALIKSLNVPAVRLLYKYGYFPFFYFLKEAGLSTLFRHPDDYGLPLILGGAETSLWDMAMIYRALGNGGIFESLHILQSSEPMHFEKKQLISGGAAYLTLNIMNELNRPGAEFYWQQYRDQWPLAWKTGTSYGNRDAWAIGVSPQWTIAVWAGNFGGRGNANLSGASSAAPLLFDIFNTLPKDPARRWFEKKPSEIKQVTLCAETGFIAYPNCPRKISVDAPRYMKPMTLCPYHKRLYVSADESEQVCSLCWGSDSYKAVSRLVYPADVRQFLRRQGQILDPLPPHRASCPAMVGGNPLKIVYPQDNAALWIPRDFDGNYQKIALRAAHQYEEETLYWYIDTHFMGSSREKHVMPVSLNKGWHKLEVIDDAGNNAVVKFYAGMR